MGFVCAPLALVLAVATCRASCDSAGIERLEDRVVRLEALVISQSKLIEASSMHSVPVFCCGKLVDPST